MEELIKANDQIESLIRSEASKPNDKIKFLTIVPGMTKSAYMDSVSKLMKLGKITKNDDGDLKYEFQLKDFETKANGILKPTFFKNRLSNFEIEILPTKYDSRELSESITEIAKTDISMLYMDKYGNYSSKNKVYVPGYFDKESSNVWVYGDCMIRLNDYEKMNIIYSHIPLSTELETEIKAKKDAIQKKQTGDI